MPISNYIGQYGDSLRRLTALSDAQPQALGQADASGGVLAGGPPPPPGALADPSGAGPALSAPPPDAMGGPPPVGALGGDGPDVGALSGPQPGAPPSVAGVGGSKIGLSHLLSAATTADKEHMTSQLEAKGINVDKKFDELKDRGFVPEGVKLSRHEKGALLTEFGLRMMAASAQGNDGFAAAGIAGQGLLESIRAAKEGNQKEATRVAERNQDIGLTLQEKQAERAAHTADITSENTSREGIADKESQSRERVAKIEAAARILAAKTEAQKSDKPVPAINQDGDTVLVYSDGHTTPVTEKVTATEDQPVAPDTGAAGGGPGTRVKPQTKKVEVTKTRPLKAGAKPKSMDMNDEQVQSRIASDKSKLLDSWDKDLQSKRAAQTAAKAAGMRLDEYAEKVAQQNIQQRAGATGGSNADPLGFRE